MLVDYVSTISTIAMLRHCDTLLAYLNLLVASYQESGYRFEYLQSSSIGHHSAWVKIIFSSFDTYRYDHVDLLFVVSVIMCLSTQFLTHNLKTCVIMSQVLYETGVISCFTD